MRKLALTSLVALVLVSCLAAPSTAAAQEHRKNERPAYAMSHAT
jgi:hypothetical protein